MSDDFDTKRSRAIGSSGEREGGKTPAEDPLIELARIVHKNKQTGTETAGGRVENTDYFAALDEVASPVAPSPTGGRLEPGFAATSYVPVEPALNSPAVSSASPAIEQTVAPLAPQVDSPSVLSEPVAPPIETRINPIHPVAEPNTMEALSQDLAPSDLDDSLSTGLEDELIGALRRSVDAPQEPAGEPGGDSNTLSEVRAAISQDYHADVNTEVLSGSDRSNTPVEAVLAPVVPQNEDFAERAQTPVVAPPGAFEQTVDGAAGYAASLTPDLSVAPAAPEAQPVGDLQHADTATHVGVPVQRPAIDEEDFFAALKDPVSSGTATDGSHQDTDSSAGIDAIFADLDFPDPAERQVGTAEPSNANLTPHPYGHAPQRTDDIDDLAWPEAAAAIPEVPEEETPPPPGGYDLDAVARAMQESDPSLKGAGVLPPHPAAEKSAAPMAEEKSRRGVFVAVGVLGLAIVGGAGFLFLDQGAGTMPDGPPPVISGLQEPLKVFPDNAPKPEDDQSAKLIYDRVGNAAANGPAQLNVQENPEPASLPPAPANAGNGAELVPGAPKQVRTLVIRPDGTIVDGSENQSSTAAPTTNPVTNETPRVVTTTPVTAGGIGRPEPQPSVPQNGAISPQEPAPVPAVPTENIVVSGPTTSESSTQPTPTPAVAEDNGQTAQVVPTVLPRTKPAAPVRVAQAPAQATSPVPTSQNPGPLELAQPATQSSTGASSSGSIAPGTYIVQVTSQRSAAAASDAYSGLQRRFPSILGGQNAVIVSANLGDRGTFYRARIPMGSRDDAVRLCEQLQGAGGDCFVRRSP